jgi:hypothetical protein
MSRGKFRRDRSRTPRFSISRQQPMIVASINGVPGQGFAEVVEESDTEYPYRAGLLKMALDNAARIQDLLDRSARLMYSGPVFANGRWCAEAFPVLVTKVVADASRSATIHIAQSELTPMARGRTIIVVDEIRSFE